jgi:aminoglycoside/choline kinase family phosphotransferase
MTLIEENKLKDLGFDNFLTGALKTNQFQVFQLAGDASSRKYYRVVQGEKSFVLMNWEPFPENEDEYPLLSVLAHFQKHKIHTPKIIAKSPKEGLLLQEDLGDLTLERKFWENQNQEHILPFYKMAIDEIIKIHYPASLDKTNCYAFKIQFDTEKFTWELNYALKNLLQDLCKFNFTAAELKGLEEDFHKISTKLDQEPKLISHRDYHSRNLMLKHGKMRVIDFQDARLGPVQYDLVSLLKDSYVELDNNLADHLLKYYLSERSRVYEPIKDLKHFNYIYEIQSVQRCFKACGSFASFFVMRNDTRYLKYIKNTLDKVRYSLNDLNEFQNLSNILEKYKIYDKEF